MLCWHKTSLSREGHIHHCGAVQEGPVLCTRVLSTDSLVGPLSDVTTCCMQAQVNDAEEHETALAGATQLQGQLASLQQQLSDTTARFAAEQQQLEAAVTAAVEGQREAESAAVEAQQQLAAARDVLAERLGEAERQHKTRMAELQVRLCCCNWDAGRGRLVAVASTGLQNSSACLYTHTHV